MTYITYQDEPGREKWLAILKLVSLFGFGLVFGGGIMFWGKKKPLIAKTTIKNSFGKIEYTTPYKNVLYENFGFVNEPKLTLPIKTLGGYKEMTFLLDSGAVVSALPLQAAREVGLDLTRAKRITLQGFSGIPTFAYFGQITIKLGEREFDFPAVFTESQKTSYILGRKGFFDQFAIYFNNKDKTVTISTKE